jgi:hypothetical protein
MGSYLPLLLIFILIFLSPPENSGSEGVSSTRALAAAQTTLQTHLLCICMVGLPPHRVLR